MARPSRKPKGGLEVRRYFVDEGGDSTLLASRGRVIIATPGCSRFFMLGLLDVLDPSSLQASFLDLRTQLLADPYFRNVPSLRPEGYKTAHFFHAKDDLPEVRKEVFSLLHNTSSLRFFAVVTDKWHVLEYVRQQNERSAEYHYHPNELYDYLVRRLFKNLLHKDGGYEIVFAKRGNSDRTTALTEAIEAARQRFARQWSISSTPSINLRASIPQKEAGLQAVDYFTWALQRLYEKGEERYLAYLWPAVNLIQDLDDVRKAGYGAYYTQKNPLSAKDLEWRNLNQKPGI